MVNRPRAVFTRGTSTTQRVARALRWPLAAAVLVVAFYQLTLHIFDAGIIDVPPLPEVIRGSEDGEEVVTVPPPAEATAPGGAQATGPLTFATGVPGLAIVPAGEAPGAPATDANATVDLLVPAAPALRAVLAMPANRGRVARATPRARTSRPVAAAPTAGGAKATTKVAGRAKATRKHTTAKSTTGGSVAARKQARTAQKAAQKAAKGARAAQKAAQKATKKASKHTSK